MYTYEWKGILPKPLERLFTPSALLHNVKSTNHVHANFLIVQTPLANYTDTMMRAGFTEDTPVYYASGIFADENSTGKYYGKGVMARGL